MGALFDAVIPNYHAEFADGTHDFMTSASKPSGASAVVGVRVNDVSTGSSLSLDLGGDTVVYDNCAVGEEIAGRFTGMNAAGSVDSIIVYYV